MRSTTRRAPTPRCARRSPTSCSKMPRGAQVIYPKDLGPILMLADIVPGRAGARVGRRLRRAVDDAAARPGADDHRLRAPRRLRRPRPARTSTRFLGADVLAATDVEVRDCYEGIDETGPRPRRARPARAVAGREARRARRCARAASCRLHADDHPGRRSCARRSSRAPFAHGRDARGAPPRLARRGPVGAARPPHGRPHRLPHPRPAAAELGVLPSCARLAAVSCGFAATRHRACRVASPVGSAPEPQPLVNTLDVALAAMMVAGVRPSPSRWSRTCWSARTSPTSARCAR